MVSSLVQYALHSDLALTSCKSKTCNGDSYFAHVEGKVHECRRGYRWLTDLARLGMAWRQVLLCRGCARWLGNEWVPAL